MNEDAVTSKQHNDYVATGDNYRRVPGAEDATSGHQYEAVFPKDDSGATIGRSGDFDQAKSGSNRDYSKEEADSNVNTDDMVQNHIRNHVNERDAAATALHQSART